MSLTGLRGMVVLARGIAGGDRVMVFVDSHRAGDGGV